MVTDEEKTKNKHSNGKENHNNIANDAQFYSCEAPEELYDTSEDLLLLNEPQAGYSVKRQGEYTLEDYYSIPDERRVELIDGYIYDMAAPTSGHQIICDEITRQINNYIYDNNGECMAISSPLDVQLDCDDRTMLQPDVVVICDKRKITLKNIVGAPDFLVEVTSPSTRKRDFELKLRKYKEAGVREYWIVDLQQKKVLVYFFENEISPFIYGLGSDVPVNIYGGRLVIKTAGMKQVVMNLM